MSVESETGRIDSIIVGIGINVNNEEQDFPEEIKEIATSICLETGRQVSRPALAAAMIEEMDALAEVWPASKDVYLSEYRRRDITCGRPINVISGSSVTPGEALMINGDFSLKVKFSDGSVKDLSSGEVSLRLI